jgi:small subunit ribosomal protein S16
LKEKEMAVKIRLARHGAKKRPFYRIVAADSEAPRDGKFLENLGTYDPLREPEDVSVKTERIKYWIEKGATPTATVKSIFKKQGLLTVTS